MENKSKSETILTVETIFHGQERGEEIPQARAYLFDSTGIFVTSEQVGEKNVVFKIEGDKNYRVVIGPDLLTDERKTHQNLAEILSKSNATSYDVIGKLNQNILHAAISKFVWFCWWETCIIVHGNIKKLINPEGPSPKYLPLCNGTVQIFQVDLGCTLDQLTSFQLITLREVLVDRLRGLPVEVEKIKNLYGPITPGSLRGARTLSSSSSRISSLEIHTHQSESSFFSKEKTRIAPVSNQINLLKSTSQTELANKLASLEGSLLKQNIVLYKPILWWLICELIPDSAFCWQELGEVPVQSDGSFSAKICFWCPDDFPDLYFEVIQVINGVTTEIYDPQIACSTYYDYDGSQSVEIVVTDPRAVACLPNGGGPDYLYVEVLGITDTDLQYIDGLNTPFISGSGLVSWAGHGQPVPFGGTLAFNMNFHPGMYGYYYRWSYKFDGDPGFTPIYTPVVHQYQELISVSPLTFQKIPVPLGPFSKGSNSNLFAFPDPSKDWISVDNYQDLFFGFFDSTGGIIDPVGYDYIASDGVSNRKSGMCTLLLEVFDSAGNFVACNNPFGTRAEGDQVSAPSNAPQFSFLLPQGNTYPTAPTGNITDEGRLLFRINVDNNQTIALLPEVTAGANSADDCGFLHFQNLSDQVSIDYLARHHEGFMNWELDVIRGHCGIAATTSANGNSPAFPSPAVASFDNSAGKLLGVTPAATCGNCPNGAAFAITLNCYAWATNGRNAQSQYDSSDIRAFAMINP
jgi:hypothetical protein